MDEQLLLRALALILWTVVTVLAPRVIAMTSDGDDDLKLQRILPVWLVEGALIAFFAGGLARLDEFPKDLASLVNTTVACASIIVAIALLWTYSDELKALIRGWRQRPPS